MLACRLRSRPTNTSTGTQKRSFRRLSARLKDAGLSKEFIQTAILPSWWTAECAQNEALLPDVEFLVARFLSAPIADVRDPSKPLTVPPVEGARLRKPASVLPSSVLPAMHAGLAIAGAVVRNLPESFPEFRGLPDDPKELRQAILRDGAREAVTLRYLLEELWSRGVPVVHVENLPSPKFRGMACMTGGRPVVLLSWGGEDHPHFLIDLAHEAGHVAKGHVTDGRPTIDVVEGNSTSSAEDSGDDAEAWEREANKYMRDLLLGEKLPHPILPDGDEVNIPWVARQRAKSLHVDSGLLVHFWSLKSGQYGKAHRAFGVLQKVGGRALVRSYAPKHIDVDSASESDASLLSCVVTEADASSD